MSVETFVRSAGGDGWCARRIRSLGWLCAAAVAGHPTTGTAGPSSRQRGCC